MRVLHPVFISGFVTLVLLALIHHIALVDFWYWRYPWLDVGVHFLGGLSIGFFITWSLLSGSLTAQATPTQSLYSALLLSLGVGLLWEWFEFSIGMPREANYLFDTKLDIASGIVGALSANLFARRFFL